MNNSLPTHFPLSARTANCELRTENSPCATRSAFTLIEMLVVIVVVGILSGLVFRMVGAGGTSSDRAQARRKVEALANACEEYKGVYGRYPPVAMDANGKQPIGYGYPNRTDNWTAGGESGGTSLANLLKDVPRSKLEAEGSYVFRFGLLSYLVPRVEGRAQYAPKALFTSNLGDQDNWKSQNAAKNSNIDKSTLKKWIGSGRVSRPSDWNPEKHCCAIDNPRDLLAAKKIAPLLEGIVRTDLAAQNYKGNAFTNLYAHVVDPWGNDLRYESSPPHDSYRIWSLGPDCKDGTADDIISGREN